MTEIVLESVWQQARGVIGRYPDPSDRYVFAFDRVRPRLIHMLGVRRPLRVTWLRDDTVVAERVLAPWTGWGRHRADRVVEARP